MNLQTCCFIGHRKINETNKLKIELCEIIENLIKDKNVGTFLFGSKSQFDDICYEIVSELKEKYPYIKRIFIRAEYPYISDEYKNFLLKWYEDTYYPEKILNAGKSVYVERNYEMINKSCFCIFYYDEKNMPTTRKSGTKIALDYAIKQNKKILLFNSEGFNEI